MNIPRQEIEIVDKSKFLEKKSSVAQVKTLGKLEAQGDIFEQSDKSNSEALGSLACLNTLASPKNKSA